MRIQRHADPDEPHDLLRRVVDIEMGVGARVARHAAGAPLGADAVRGNTRAEVSLPQDTRVSHAA